MRLLSFEIDGRPRYGLARDDGIVDLINGRGGLTAIAASHPRFHGSLVEWSRVFGGVPVFLHSADREWLMGSRPRLGFGREIAGASATDSP